MVDEQVSGLGGQKRSIFRDAWRLSAPYWRSEERWSAWGLVAILVALNLGNVYIDVRINQWNNAFYNALQEFNAPEFFRQLGIFCILAGVSIMLSVYALYLNQMLQIRWRRWLTRRYLRAWLADRTYFRLQLQSGETDNPDQRISDDLNQFTTYVLSLSLGLLSAVVSLVSFLFILWGLSGPAEISLFGLGTVHIPAYLVWAALIYAGFGTWLTIRIGRPLVPLNFLQQRYEADFRFSMVRLRESAESIAFYGGEAAEEDVFAARFTRLFDNFWGIMRRRKLLNWFTSGYGQVAVVFPVVVVAPRYFSKEIQLGGLMQVVDAFSSVQNSLSFIINAYSEIAAWQAVTQRLSTFDERMRAIAASIHAPQRIAHVRSGAGIEVAALDLDLPDATPLLRGVTFAVGAGEALLIAGPTGIGKSTVMRAIAGLWPWGSGTIRVGEGSWLFLPQRPYLPLGTLEAALRYPFGGEGADNARLVALLHSVGLGSFAGELDAADNWAQRLSPGEQQRVAFARVLLVEPAYLFLDEASSALDEAAEANFYGLLRAARWRPTVISVGHRSTLRGLHDQIVDITRFRASGREIEPAAD
jgi:vitamin B12/bleomycin/antimicrobial peptide transport system ATP-binding/permease protein